VQAAAGIIRPDLGHLSLQARCNASAKAWVLGENRFKQQLEQSADGRAPPLSKVGIKSKAYKNQRI
jgi:hypothetical protein